MRNIDHCITFRPIEIVYSGLTTAGLREPVAVGVFIFREQKFLTSKVVASINFLDLPGLVLGH